MKRGEVHWADLAPQVTTLDRGRLVERVGSLTSEQLSIVMKGLKAALDMD